MKPGRIACCVPFCGRTAPENGYREEIICSPHWRLARAPLKRRLARVRRILRRAWARGDEGDARRALALNCAIWRKIKREVIEVAVGIAG